MATRGNTKKTKIVSLLLLMGVGDNLDIKELLKTYWGDDHEFIRRSFDVYLCVAKKEITNRMVELGDAEPRQYKVEKSKIIRLK